MDLQVKISKNIIVIAQPQQQRLIYCYRIMFFFTKKNQNLSNFFILKFFNLNPTPMPIKKL